MTTVSTTHAATVEFDHVTKVYGASAAKSGTPGAVNDLSLTVPAGKICVLVGPSGCGKTTSLKMVNRLIEPTSGRILLDGVDAATRNVTDLRRGIGYVIQQTGLFPHKTIAANIATVPSLLGWSKERIRERTSELVDLVGLDPELLRRYPAELSGGQQQRVGVARALAADPPILLMDEPYSAVDPIVRARLQDELVALQHRLHKTIVLVTHDIDEAIKLADYIAILNVGGVLEQFGPPADLLRSPANEFVASFLGRERALKRMALLRVADVDLVTGPVVEVGASVDEAQKVMAEQGVDWIGLRDGDRLLGWAWSHDLDGASELRSVTTEPFRAWVRPSTALREALDLIVDSSTRVAAVFDDDDRYLGILTINQIADGMAK